MAAELTGLDRCDQCGDQAQAVVRFPTSGIEVLMCAGCFASHGPRAVELGGRVLVAPAPVPARVPA